MRRGLGVLAGGLLLPIFGSMILPFGLITLLLIPLGLVAGFILSLLGSALGAAGAAGGRRGGGGFWIGGSGGGCPRAVSAVSVAAAVVSVVGELREDGKFTLWRRFHIVRLRPGSFITEDSK